MESHDYNELKAACVDLQDKVEKLGRAHTQNIFALQEAKIIHQKVLEEIQILLREHAEALDHASDVFRQGKHVKLPDRERTFERIEALLKETENR